MKFVTTILLLIAVLDAVCGYSIGGIRFDGPLRNIPCPKNYVFSCQPNLAPVPCAGVPTTNTGGHTGGHVTVGAYSENVPMIVNAPPPQHYQGLPSNFLQNPYYYIKN